MTDPHCRIENVRMKDKKIAALPVRPRQGMAVGMPHAMQSCIDALDGDVCGYAIVSWDRHGNPAVQWANDAIRGIIPHNMISLFCQQAIISAYMDWNGEADG